MQYNMLRLLRLLTLIIAPVLALCFSDIFIAHSKRLHSQKDTIKIKNHILLLNTVVWFSTFSLAPTFSNNHIGDLSGIVHARNIPESNGANGLHRGTAEALKPILLLRNNVKAAKGALTISVDECKKELQTLPSNEKDFKRLFDEFSEDVSYKQRYLDQNAFLVYYTQGFDGPGRPRIDSDSDKSNDFKMTQQFGFRNEGWIAVDDARSEVNFLMESSQAGRTENQEDLIKALDAAETAIYNYLNLAPPNILDDAEKLIH